MANVSSIAPVEVFEDYAQRGLISLRPHYLNDDLVVANYTPLMVFKQPWDEVTLNSRGLIFYKSTGEIAARAFRKFFNWGQGEAAHIDTTGPIEVANKEDGSMGVLYLAPDGEYSISTRGSMASEQALHATELYRSKYAGIWTPDEDHTFIYEIVYPAGRIVIDYNGLDDLILIGAVNKETGRTATRETLLSFGWPGPVAESYPFASMEDVFKADQERNREGFVIHFVDADERLKVKFEEYLTIHRLLFNLNERRVWEVMAQGLDVDEWLAELPDEFTTEAKSWRDGIQSRLDDRLARSKDVYEELKARHGDDRKRFALDLQAMNLQDGLQGLVFGRMAGWDESRVVEKALDSLKP